MWIQCLNDRNSLNNINWKRNAVFAIVYLYIGDTRGYASCLGWEKRQVSSFCTRTRADAHSVTYECGILIFSLFLSTNGCNVCKTNSVRMRRSVDISTITPREWTLCSSSPLTYRRACLRMCCGAGRRHVEFDVSILCCHKYLIELTIPRRFLPNES